MDAGSNHSPAQLYGSGTALAPVCVGTRYAAQERVSRRRQQTPILAREGDVLVGRSAAAPRWRLTDDDVDSGLPRNPAAIRLLDIGSCWYASVGIKGDQQVYPLSSVNLLVYGVAIS
jgi:hypothetical protein